MEFYGIAFFPRERLAQREHKVQQALDAGVVLWKLTLRQIVSQSVMHRKEGRVCNPNLDTRLQRQTRARAKEHVEV